VRKAFAWSGALLFLVSLSAFVYAYGWRLRTPAPETGSAIRDAILNTAVFTIFALHHSIMARTGAKEWIKRLVPPDLERAVYVWIASLLFLAVCVTWRPLPGLLWSTGGAVFWALTALQLIGVGFTLRASQVVGVWELTGVVQPDQNKPYEFTASGPFAIVRHPIYFGWLLIVFATPVMTASQLLFALISSAYIVVAIPFEERSLLEAFPEKYRAYQRRMRWRLVPGVW
jgi:methanethiol S-methyltransferase